jgi:hypothetical protein
MESEMVRSNRNTKLKVVEASPIEPQPEAPKVEAKAGAKPEPAKAEAKKPSAREAKSEWKRLLKVALFENPKLSHDDIAKLVIKGDYPSRASTNYAVNETLHTLRVLKEQGLYSHPGI